MKFAQKLLNSSLGLFVLGFMVLQPIEAIAKPRNQRPQPEIAIPLSQTKVPGTAVTLTPPDGFKASKLFTGFEHLESGASMMVTEMPIPQAAQQKVMDQLSSSDVLKSKGMRLISGQETTINGHRGRLLLVSQEVQGILFLKWIAVLAKGDRALMVVAPFPESESPQLREPIQQAILNLKWQPGIQASLLEGLPFSFQERGDLKISGRASNTVFLSKNGAKPPIPASDPLLIVGVAYQEMQIPDVARFARKHLNQISQVRDVTEISGDRKTISGQKAFEIVAQGYDVKTNTPLTIYHIIITTDKTYYILQGLVTRTGAEQYLPIFRTIAESFIPKI